MNFLCPACQSHLPIGAAPAVVACPTCGVAVDLTRVDTSPGQASLSPEVDLTSETLGTYRLERRIGSGGMGAVYQAQGSAGPAAVKVLSPLLAADPTVRERFRREAAALRAVNHPGVVRVLDDGETKGFCWYAMEYVAGADLRARLHAGPMAADPVRALAAAVLEALAAVHDAGLVHRDVKPGNLLLGEGGPKLCDFGIARFDGAATLTESAALLGSLRYMAPEQRLGRSDARTDLHALGLVLHEALTGGLPLDTTLPSSTPGPLKRLITALTQARPELRPVDARAAMAMLRPVGATRRALRVAAGVLLISGSVGGWMIRSRLGVDASLSKDRPAPNLILAAVDAGQPDAGQPDAGASGGVAALPVPAQATPEGPRPKPVLAVSTAPSAPPGKPVPGFKGKPTKKKAKVFGTKAP